MTYPILSIRDNPELLTRAVAYFSDTWSIDRNIYSDCITHSISTSSPLPRWYLMMDENKIIGSYGLIVNDFCSRQDIWPYLAALHVEPEYRGQSLGSVLLRHGQNEAKRLGFDTLYLTTEHIGYYEKYDWIHIGSAYSASGKETRLYKIETY